MERHPPYKLTKEGLNKLKIRLQKTEEGLRRLLSQKQEIAVTQGDYWHDNPTFNQLEMDERALRLQISDLRDKLTRVVIVEEKSQGDEARIGSFVVIIFKEDKRKMELTIVDPETSQPSKGFISYTSPLGRAILGTRPGDVRTYSVGEKKFQVKVVRVGRKENG